MSPNICVMVKKCHIKVLMLEKYFEHCPFLMYVCMYVTDVTVLSRRGPIEGPRSIANVP